MVARPFYDLERWSLVIDAQVTRRKYYHFVIDPQGECRFKSRLFWECVEYCQSENVERLVLLDMAKRSTRGALILSTAQEQP